MNFLKETKIEHGQDLSHVLPLEETYTMLEQETFLERILTYAFMKWIKEIEPKCVWRHSEDQGCHRNLARD